MIAVIVLVALSAVAVRLGLKTFRELQTRRQINAQRARVDSEVRLAEWRLQRVTHAAMQRLLDEARRSS